MMMSLTYYREYAQAFFDSTVDVDMAPLYQIFLPLIPPGGHILDAGCGSGRDSKAFLDSGFQVTAMDASAELARLAERLIGQKVTVCRFQEFASDTRFDAIWACASLLHISRRGLTTISSWLPLAPQP